MNQPSQTKQQHLSELVYEKNRWDEPLSEEDKAKGFLGWHERGHLPHCDKPGLSQFVTIRLADSMPVAKRAEWQHLLDIEDNKEKRKKLEEYLDRGSGGCHLRDKHIAEITEGALLHFHQKEYELMAWCVMPNHVHVLVHVWETPLCRMIQRWKRYSSGKALKILHSERQTFWQRDYWDTFMRDLEQERMAIRYIESNPLKAGLCKSPIEWGFGSARFRDEYHRLIVPPIPISEKQAG